MPFGGLGYLGGIGLMGATGNIGVPPVVANQSVDFGNLTKASAGGFTPVNSGGTITSASIDSGDASGHWQISSSGIISPSTTGDTANLNGGPYTLGCTFNSVGGSDTATITVSTIANSYSVTTMAELKAASADIGTASGGARTVYCRSGNYTLDTTAIQSRAYSNRVTFTKHTGATPIFAGITIHTSTLVTLDGLTFYRAASGVSLISIVGASESPIVQNCTLYGDTINTTGDYTAALPVVPENGINIGASVGYPSDVSILNNYIHDVIIGMQVGCDGAMRVEGNKIENTFSDGIKIAYRSGQTSVTVLDNTINGVIGADTDFGSPHPDFIQFIGGLGTETGDWSNITVGRNTTIARYARSGAQGIFFEDMTEGSYFYNEPYVYGNLLINCGLSTGGIRIRQAKNARVIGNTVVKQTSLTGTGPGIVVGDDTSSGTHEIRNNAADSYNVAGSPTLTNNVTLGSGGATIAYSTAFDGPTFTPTTVANARTSFNMKAAGPLDLEVNVGAVGSGYITWATTEPGNDGSVDTSFEGDGFQALAGDMFVNTTGTRQAFAGGIFINEAA